MFCGSGRMMRGGKIMRDRARRLRSDPTEAEKRLWAHLRGLRKSHGIHVRRQCPVGPYVVDFAMSSRRLIVEVDGGQHADGADAVRDAWLKSQGYTVLRFWNSEVFENLEGVLETIFGACGAPEPEICPTHGPSLHAGRGVPSRISGKAPPRLRGGVGVGPSASREDRE